MTNDGTYKLLMLELDCGELWVEVRLNEVPLVRVPDGTPKFVTQKGNPWLIEGPNRLELLLAPPPGQDAVGTGARCVLHVYEIEWGNAEATPSSLARYEWIAADTPIEEPAPQRVLDEQLAPTQTHGRWTWEDATPYDDSQRSAVEALVSQVHQALQSKDVSSFATLTALKNEELARALDVPLQELLTEEADGLRELSQDPDYQVAPVDLAELVLEPTAAGRLVNVSDAKGQPPLRVAALGGTTDMPLTVSHLPEQGWTIVR